MPSSSSPLLSSPSHLRLLLLLFLQQLNLLLRTSLFHSGTSIIRNHYRSSPLVRWLSSSLKLATVLTVAEIKRTRAPKDLGPALVPSPSKTQQTQRRSHLHQPQALLHQSQAASREISMGEEDNIIQCSENGGEGQMKEREEEELVLQLLDSTDSYLTLIDSLSSTLRQGWLELASARHSMGSSRVNSALFDLKLHPAATTLQVTQLDNESPSRDPMGAEPHFTLSKWVSSCDAKGRPRKSDVSEEHKQSNVPTLRRRGASQPSDDKEPLESNGPSVTVDDQVEKVRSKSLSVFGTLVSPKLRTSQHSFEKALETVVEIANMRSLTLSAYAQLQNDMDTTT